MSLPKNKEATRYGYTNNGKFSSKYTPGYFDHLDFFFGTKTVLDVASSKVSRITVVSLIIALVVLIVATGFYFGLRTPAGENKASQPINSGTPTAQPADALTTMSAFCSFIQSHSFGVAYQFYSDNYQKKVSANDFQQKWNMSYEFLYTNDYKFI